MGTTTLSTLREKIARACGLYHEGTTTTAIGGANTIIDTSLENEFHSDDALIGKWILVTSGANDAVERVISDYTANGGIITVYGTSLASDGATLATYEIHTFKPSDYTQAINETIEEEFNRIYREIEDTSLFTVKNQSVYNVPSGITDVFKIYLENPLDPEFDENILYEEGASVDFEDWASSSYPDGVDSTTNITCSKYGTRDQQENWVPTQYGDYLMKAKSSGVAGNVKWVITNPADYAGQRLTLSMPFYSRSENEWRVEINDGVGQTRSDYHGGTGWENLEVTHDVADTPSELSVYLKGSGNSKVGYGAQIILGRSEYYLSKAWTPLAGWSVFNDKIWFNQQPTPNRFLRVIGKAELSTVSADSDRVEKADPALWILVWGSARYLYRAEELKHIGKKNNPFTDQVKRCEIELSRARSRYGNTSPTLERNTII